MGVKRRKQPQGRTHSLWSNFGTLKTFVLAVGLLHYLLWAVTLMICSGDLIKSGSNHGPSLFFPLDVYAWSVGQTLSTLGILRPLSEVLTRKAWDSFEKREQRKSSAVNAERPTHHPNNATQAAFLPPTEIRTLHVGDFWNAGDNRSGKRAGADARAFLEATYGKQWREAPLLLKGLWTVDELADSSGSRRLTPKGLMNQSGNSNNRTGTAATTSELVIPYFSDATKAGALKPDAQAPLQSIVSAMVVRGRPHKIGSQLLVQNDPSLMDEVVPLDFARDLFGDHFSKNHLVGNPSRTGWRSWFPGTTTVPVFIANTSPIHDKDKANHLTKSEDDGTGGAGECVITGGDSGESSGPNPSMEAPPTNASTTSNSKDTDNDDKPFTGLHCEPIANVAVQLWGSRTWTLVDPKHSWRIKPSISSDGRSFYPSSVSMNVLKTQIPRYEVTTTPGDALWLPTWTYHKVDYVYHQNESDSDSKSRDDGNSGKATTLLHEHKLSIGASLFHFRPIDFLRRNPLFALLMMPSMVRELAGIATQ